MVPTDFESWWRLCEKNWDGLLEIIAHHIDITSPAYDPPGQGDALLTGRSVIDELIHLKRQRTVRSGAKLARYFNGAWCLASEAYAYSVPGWGALCDLCSEEWALYPCEGCGSCEQCSPGESSRAQ